MTEKVKILICDDHTLFREGIKAILGQERSIEIVGEAHDGREAVTKAQELTPDVVLMDISMPVMNGIEATRQICEVCKNTKVAILSMHHTSEYLQRALKAGAQGYLLKDSAGAEVIAAIHALHEGKSYFSQKIVGL